MIVINEGIAIKLDLLRITASVTSSPDAKGDIIIPSVVTYSDKNYIITSIEENAFLNNNFINSIDFAKNSQVLKICKNAFAHSSLKKLCIPKSVTILEEGWCLNANKLCDVEISPKSHHLDFVDDKLLMSKDGKNIFFAQKYINKIDIPTSVKIISSFSFANCTNLQNINFYKRDEHLAESKIFPILPTKVMKIDSTSLFFNEIKYQTDYFEIPDASENELNTTTEIEVTKVGESAFKPINDLMPFTYMSVAIAARYKLASAIAEKKRNKKSETSASSLQEYNEDITDNNETKIDKKPNHDDDDDLIPEFQLIDTDLEELGEFAFSNCTSLTVVRSIPSTVKKVGCYCFSGNFNLITIEFLSKELVIDNNIFLGCEKLESVSFPNAQKILFGSMTFNGLTKSISLYILPGAYVKII